MQKLFRSLFAIGALATLAACGDDVTVTPPSDPLAISGAPVTAIAVGAKVQLSANRPVTWATSDATVATVDATGLVTAVKGGVATITATSTEDPDDKASVTITVTPAVNATISVNNITQAGVPGNPTINVNNVAGSIDVNLNVVPGDQQVQRVEVLIDGAVACTQNLIASPVVSAEAAIEVAQSVPVSCQVNTAEFNPTTGVAKFLNGPKTLSARAILLGGATGAATPSTPLVFNNQSGFIAAVTNTNTKGGPATATNTTNGTVWRQGDVTLTLTGVSYASGQGFTAATVTFLGCTISSTTPTGSVFTFAFPATANDTSCPERDDYTSTVVEVPTVTSVVTGGGSGPSSILNLTGPPVASPTVAVFPTFRLDNGDPVVTAPATQALWVTSATSFAAGQLGTPAISATSDAGVDANTAQFWATPAGGTLPSGCSTTGLTQITTGSQLAETTVNTAYTVRVIYRDALFNLVCFTLGTVGADFVAPTIVSTTGPANNSAFDLQANIPDFTFNVTDNASGFGTNPVNVRIVRLDSANAAFCVLGTGSGCTATNVPLTFDATNSLTNSGYYTITYTVRDQAGNATSSTTVVVLLDQVDPTWAGGVSLPSAINGAATNTFTATPSDNLDLASVNGVVAYPTINIQYPSQSLGTYGSPLERGGSAIGYAVANWMRCVNAAGDFASTTNQPTTITMVAVDQAGNTGSVVSPTFGANAQACGAVGASSINNIGAVTVTLGTGKTQVDIDGSNLATASQTTADLQTIADVPTSVSVDPFVRMDFYYETAPASGIFRLAGSATGTLAQTPTTRTYTYKFTWDPDANVPVGTVNVIAIGVDAQGDAVRVNGTTLTTVQ